MTQSMKSLLDPGFAPLQRQLLDAAEQFSTDAKPLSELLETMVRDVSRAMAEPLEIFPVAHHCESNLCESHGRTSRGFGKGLPA